MALQDVKDVVDEQASENTGKTNARLDAPIVSQLKREAGVRTNADVAPLIDAAIAEYVGDDEAAEEYEQRFREQVTEDEDDE